MRILILGDARSPHTWRWVEHFRDRGDEVHVASFRERETPGTQLHLLRTFGLGKAGYLLNVVKLGRLYRALQPDIVHAHHVTSYGLLAAVAGLQPLIVTTWGSDILVTPRESRVLRWATSWALRAATKVTTVAEHMVPAVTALGVPRERVSSITFGVDRGLFNTNGRATPTVQPFTIVSTRMFAPIYDVPTLIRALARLRDRGLEFRALLVGDGPLREQIKTFLTKLDIADRVTLLGFVEPAHLPETLRQSDVFVSASLSDGNNVSLTESMACGCFPVASDIPANRSWIESGRNGMLFPVGNDLALADCLEQCARAPELLETAQSINQRIVADTADWAVSARSMEALYDLVTASHVH